MPRSILSCVRMESCQVANISAKLFKRGCKNFLWMRKNREFGRILKYFYHKSSKNMFIKSAGFFVFGKQKFYIWPGLAAVGKKMILSIYLAVGAM